MVQLVEVVVTVAVIWPPPASTAEMVALSAIAKEETAKEKTMAPASAATRRFTVSVPRGR